MKGWKAAVSRFNIFQAALFLFVIGWVLGILFANVFREHYFQQINAYQQSLFTEVTNLEMDYRGLFWYTLKDNLKDFAVFWLLSITILGIPYMIYRILAFGFTTGFFIAVITMSYGIKGFLLLLVFPFPHGLIYLPVMLMSLYKGYYLCNNINNDRQKFMSVFRQQRKQYFLLLIVLVLLLLAASFLEAYAGAFILKKTLNLFT